MFENLKMVLNQLSILTTWMSSPCSTWLVVILILWNNVSAFKRTNSDLWKVPRSIFTTIWMFFSKWWFRTIFQIFEYFPDFPLKRVRHTQFTFGWDFWLQMLPKNFLWGLETCLKYVTTSPDLGLSNGTKIVAFGALEKIRHPYLKKRRPHLAFESYFSKCVLEAKTSLKHLNIVSEAKYGTCRAF